MDAILDAVLLSRIQLGFTLAFHILFPTLTIGLAGYLVILEGLWLWRRDEVYLRLYRFWLKIFAVSFGIGVVSGIVLSFEFGTNFGRFSAAAGNVIGPLMTYEVLGAFFLEASFLPIMLFGWGRVGPRLHFIATCMVSLGTVISAFFILSANSWMHTPAGFALRDGVFYVTDWLEVIFNPSFPYRLVHMLMASLLTSAFIIAGVSAWHFLNGRHLVEARRAIGLAIVTAAVLAPAQVVVGDLHGLQVQRDQPMKVAAMEGVWETARGVPMLLFAVPDQSAATNHFEIGIPYAASIILQHSPDGRVLGLDEVAPEDRPPVIYVFYAFRTMVGIGFLFVALAWVGAWLLRRERLAGARWYLWALVLASPLGFLAVVAGWIVTEVGRQPWVVYGLMRTADGASPLPAGSVATSLLLFVIVYHAILAAFLYFFWRIVRAGPEEALPPDVVAARTAGAPAS